MTDGLAIDGDSVDRMVEHHVSHGLAGVFIGGTCGEGPLMPRSSLRELTRRTSAAAADRLQLAVQTTDNSAVRVLGNIEEAKEDGADIAVVAEPWFSAPRSTEEYLRDHYLRIAEESVLPIGLYIRSVSMGVENYRSLFGHSKICMIKDSSIDVRIMGTALSVLAERSDLAVLTGYEFDVVSYLKAGYSGVLAGGAILTGSLLVRLCSAFRSGDVDAARELERTSIGVLHTAYGGPSISSWLTGLKYALVQMGVFSTRTGYLTYPLPEEVARGIDEMVERGIGE
jgi:dihydrodipicolinate synthase/N-acetylneuraminate lyase